MRDQITNDVLTCAICQTQKKQSKKYGLLPEKEAEAMPWDRLCINLISPYNIKSNVKGVKIPPLKCVTMINPATGWFKIKQYDDKKSGVSNFKTNLTMTRMSDPWGGILAAIAFVLRFTYHMTLQGMPGQLILGRDMVLNVQHLTDWTAIKACKQQIIC
jgi:hypothetical protein